MARQGSFHGFPYASFGAYFGAGSSWAGHGLSISAHGSSSASGEDSSASLKMFASVGDEGERTVGKISLVAKADAKGTSEAPAHANADTDATASGADVVTVEEHDASVNDGIHASALSSIRLEAVKFHAVDLEALSSSSDSGHLAYWSHGTDL